MEAKTQSQPKTAANEKERICMWIAGLCNKEERLQAMLELCERRSRVEDLGLMLWQSFGAVAALLQEVVSMYPTVLDNQLTNMQSQRICAAIGLFQAMACHPQVALRLLRCHCMSYLLPLLKLTPQTRAVEHVRLSVLGVVGGLLKSDHDEIVGYFLNMELIPIVLGLMEKGSSMSKVVNSFVLCRILGHEMGLQFATREEGRRLHVVHTLARVVHQLTLELEPRVLKYIVRTFTRLAEHPETLELIKLHLPPPLRNGFFCKEPLSGYENVVAELADLNRKLNDKKA
ncbi:hypothetical protein KR018_002228 [Drosophila ironensis]|nr:hypothetical protein KR018_002228 [Drosophila ironensis]